MPKQVRDGVIAGLYRVREPESKQGKDTPRVHLFGSGAILREALRAAEWLENDYDVAPTVWSATSYSELARDCLETERWNRLHPTRKPRESYLQATVGKEPVPVVAATDYVKAVPGQIARWLPETMITLGTDGFGRSDDRESLRRHFEVSAEHIAVSALAALSRDGQIDRKRASQAIKSFSVDPEALNPLDA
jgi:pyruvate dehydrogenase E1 component